MPHTTKTIDEIRQFAIQQFIDHRNYEDFQLAAEQSVDTVLKALADHILGLPSLQPIEGDYLIANSINEYVRATRHEIAEALGVKK